MSEIETTDPTLTALRLAEERACAGYVDARNAQVQLGTRLVSLRRLTVEQPRRADYRQALAGLARRYRDARERTDLALARWHEAQLCTDGRWTDTAGRTRGQAAAAGEAA
jgi:hypothetical protein